MAFPIIPKGFFMIFQGRRPLSASAAETHVATQPGGVGDVVGVDAWRGASAAVPGGSH